MFHHQSGRSVEVTFVAAPPIREVERASGVSAVEVDARVIRCVVTGSFQPFLEALRGHEVIDLTSIPVLTRETAEGGEH